MEEDPQLPEPDRLLAATLYLMSCHARSGCPRLACMVSHHLNLIAGHPDAGEQVRHTCRQLEASWVSVRERDERRDEPASVLEILRSAVH